MWHDHETDLDFLNFESYAKTVSQIILKAEGQPISIGVSGAWGTGKSSMLKLIQKDLQQKNGEDCPYLFVRFNAWLYQGFDDARAALLDVIAKTLEKEAEENEGAREAVLRFLKKVDWVRVAGIGAQAALFASTGFPPVGIIGSASAALKNIIGDKKDQITAEDTSENLQKVASQAGELIKERESQTPPQHIQELRDSFEKALESLDKTLVVFVDDLDRCLPETAIATLEAMRLFLFLDRTAFIIAADSHVIKLAVRKHFGDTEDNKLITSYFDKLIQVPIQVPPLGTQEVRAYLILLTINRKHPAGEIREKYRKLVCEQLAKSWEGKRVDDEFVDGWTGELGSETVEEIRSKIGLAHLLTTSSEIAGNPRLIKRFLNALSLRESLAKAHSITVNVKALAKLLLLERCGGQEAYAELVKTVTASQTGMPDFLEELESKVRAGKEDVPLAEPWNSDFHREWLGITPELAKLDLRKELYVSRESAALISPEDRLSMVGAQVLRLLIERPAEAKSIKDELESLSQAEMTIVFSKLLEAAEREVKWGTPPILESLLVCISINDSLGKKFAAFLKARPARIIEAPLIPRIRSNAWATELFSYWSQHSDISSPVKNAISPSNSGASAKRSKPLKGS